MRKIVIPALVLILLLALWQIASVINPTLSLVLPAPSKIIACLIEQHERLYHHTKITVQEMALGGLFAFFLAFPLAWLMAYKVWMRGVLQPIFVVIQSVPMFALAPIMVVWFDWSRLAIIIPTALMIFFPLTMNLYQGITSVPRHFLDYFRLHRATGFQLFFKLQLPWSYPFFFSGMRISSAIAGIGAVAGEWAGGQEGLGILMLESRKGADLELAFAALFCLTMVSMLLYLGTLWAEMAAKRRRGISFKSTALLTIFCGTLLVFSLPESDTRARLVLDFLPNPNHIPLYVGIEKGFFSARGLPVKIHKVVDPSNNISYLVADQAEIAVSYTTHLIRAKEKGVKVQPVGVLIEEPLLSILFKKESGIKTPEDLTAKRIGYCIDGTSTRFLNALLTEAKVVPSEVKNCTFDLVSTFGTNKVDAVYGVYWNIEGEFLKSFGVDIDHFSVKAFGVPSPYELILVAKEGVSDAFIATFQEAMKESIDFCRAHPDEAFHIWAACHPDKREKTLEWERRAWEKTLPLLAKTQTVDNQKIAEYRSWLFERGLL